MSVAIGALDKVRAAIFDFNGTITDDEELQYAIFAELFAEGHDISLNRATYYDTLAGMSDPAIVQHVLESHGLPADSATKRVLIEERLRRYQERVQSSPPVRPGTAALIRRLAGAIPLAVATGAFREEVESVLEASALLSCFSVVVTIDDVRHGKPDPEGFKLALSRLNATLSPAAVRLAAHDVVVFEDSPFGVTAAQECGMRCVAAHTTHEAVAADLSLDELSSLAATITV